MLHQVDNSSEKTLDRIHVWKISMCTYVKKLKHTSQIDEYKWIQISNLWLTVLSPTMTVTEKTTDTTLETGIAEDDTSGREKPFKNFIYSAYVRKYPLWNM